MRLGVWRRLMPLWIVVFGFGGWACLPTAAQLPQHPQAADVVVYTDSLDAAWDNWSWDTNVDFAATAQVHAGSAALQATFTAAWGGLSLRVGPALNASGYSALEFAIYGGPGGTQLNVNIDASDSGGSGTPVSVSAAAGTWSNVSIPLAQFGVASIARLNWMDATGSAQPAFYLDDITLVGTGVVPLSLAVDAQASRRSISSDIYGMNFPAESLAQELDLPVARWGGNSTSRYNWQTSISNTAQDYFYENIPMDRDTNRTLPDGSASDLFIEQNRRTGTQSIITIPGMGYVARADSPTNHPYFCGFPASVYPSQQSFDPWDTNCGNGRMPNGTPITGNDPGLTSAVVGTAFVQSWMDHLITAYGAANSSGVRFYALDNEPMLWSDTHRDIHPQPTSYDEVRDLATTYAPAIKQRDPNAQILGPELWGWVAYFYSALDQADPNWPTTSPDRAAHGDVPFAEWYLQQMQDYETQHGQRILDYFDIHYYPQANGVSLSPAGSSSTQALRLRSTRSLWDPTYQDESWIDAAVNLIPRMRDWVDTNYPGTKLAISEYNWGALDDINGALAQADVLGIFGREGLDLATLWSPPAPSEPGAFAFRLYRNYDGNGGQFGSTSVAATSSDQDQLAIYAAERSDQALTIMVINKTGSDITQAISLANFAPASSAEVYRYSAANLNAIEHLPAVAVGPSSLTTTFTANSATLLVVPSGTPVNFNHVISLPMVRK